MELNVYKQIGETTAELSSRIKKQYNAKKVAVCGKLDPMARGLTKVLLDDKTKLMENEQLKSCNIEIFKYQCLKRSIIEH